MIRACWRNKATASWHLVRNDSVPPGSPETAGNCDWRKESQPAIGRNHAGFSNSWSKAPRTTQLWARTVLARLGQRAVYSWKVQVPQTWGLPRWTLVSSTAETR